MMWHMWLERDLQQKLARALAQRLPDKLRTLRNALDPELSSRLTKEDPHASPIESYLNAIRELAGLDSAGPLVMWLEQAELLAPDEATQRLIGEALTRLRGAPGQLAASDWRGTDEALTTGQEGFLPVRFLALGAERARAVVLIRLPNGTGTGFLIGQDILVTNHHVLPNPASCAEARVIFGYERDALGDVHGAAEVGADAARGFYTNPDDDLTLTRVGDPQGFTFTPIPLSPRLVAVGSRVQIVQHPRGEHKQLALDHNRVAWVGEARIQYFTDTESGSSGAPVFNDAWELVAIHHQGEVRERKSPGFVCKNQGVTVSRLLLALERPEVRLWFDGG